MKIYDITPIGKPRMTRADKWKQRPAVMRYRAFCDAGAGRTHNLRGSHAKELEPEEASNDERTGTPAETRRR